MYLINSHKIIENADVQSFKVIPNEEEYDAEDLFYYYNNGEKNSEKALII